MNKFVCYLLLCLVSFGLLTNVALAEERTIQIQVDPRIELLAVVQYLSGYGERGILTRFDLEYKEDIMEYFAAYKDHKAVKMFAKMSSKGFTYDAPPTAMLYLSNPPELERQRPYSEYLKKRAGIFFGGWKLDRFAKALREFAVDTNFMEFFNQHEDFYAQIVQESQKAIAGESYIPTLEEYYGVRHNSFNIILAPLFHPGGYGPNVELANGTYDIFNIMGPVELKNNLPYFGSREQFRYLAWHEFGHSFVNPTTDLFRSEINEYKSLFKPIAGVMKQQGYNQWEISLNEHLVRTVTTRLAYLKFGQEVGDQARDHEKNRGFAYIDHLLKALEEYEQNRDQYPTFKDFYPEVIKVLADLSSQDLGPDFYRIPYFGSINGAMRNKEDIVIILPTQEKDQQVEEEIHQFVEKYRELFFPKAPLLTDQQALEQDLSDKAPIIFGTVDGNLWLKKYVDQMPFSVEPDQIVVQERTYQGNDLKLIISMANLFNPDQGMVIYTAQQMKDIVGINNVFHGPTDYVVGRGKDVIDARDYK